MGIAAPLTDSPLVLTKESVSLLVRKERSASGQWGLRPSKRLSEQQTGLDSCIGCHATQAGSARHTQRIVVAVLWMAAGCYFTHVTSLTIYDTGAQVDTAPSRWIIQKKE